MKITLAILALLLNLAGSGQSTDFKKMNGTLSKAELTNIWGVEARLTDFEFDAKFKVTRYDFLLLKKSGELLTAANSGAVFSSKIKKWLTAAQPGDVLFIENIKAIGPDNRERNIGSLAEKIY
ncbi:MAG: GldM family protein [Chitinophagales bacterium]